MRVLVTGSDGYIGSVLMPILIEAGHEVVGLDTGLFRAGVLFDPGPQRWDTINKDVRNIVEEDLSGFDAVVHLAELANDPLGARNPEVTLRINHQASVALARNCKRVGVRRFVYMSSCSVYGWEAKEVLTENAALRPQTTYAQCKVLVERDVSALADTTFAPTFLRNGTAYGVSPSMRFDLVLNNITGQGWTKRRIAMTSDGSPWRPLVHIRDISKAIRLVLTAPTETVCNQVFNVGTTAENWQVRQLAEIVAEVIPGCSIKTGKSDGDNRGYRVAFEKIHTALPEFACDWDVANGTRELCELFKSINLDSERFEFRGFSRLKQLEYLVSVGEVTEDLTWRTGGE